MLLTSESNYSFLEWDSNFFGFRIARLETRYLSPVIVEEVFKRCKADQIRCLYFQSALDDPETIHQAEINGFHLVDIRTELKIKLPVTIETLTSDISIRSSNADDLPFLEPVASDSYVDSRFFFDSNFPRSKCRELYRLWLRKSIVSGYADDTIVGVYKSKPSGFVTLHLDQNNKEGRIGLVGVDASVRGIGLGYALIRQALNQFMSFGMSSVMVPTQVRNIPAQRLYQQAGFKTDKVYIWYHKWF